MFFTKEIWGFRVGCKIPSLPVLLLFLSPPPPPAEVQEVSSIEASEILKNQPDIAILDVRPPEERAKASLSNSQMLDNHIAQEIQWTLLDDRPFF